MVLLSRLLRRGAGGTLKSTLSAAGDMICTFMPFLLWVAARRLCGGLREFLGVSHGTEHNWRGHQRQGTGLGVDGRNRAPMPRKSCYTRSAIGKLYRRDQGRRSGNEDWISRK